MSDRRTQELDNTLVHLYDVVAGLQDNQVQAGTQPLEHVVVNDETQDMSEAEQESNMDINEQGGSEQDANESSSSSELLRPSQETIYDEHSADESNPENEDLNIEENAENNGKKLNPKLDCRYNICIFRSSRTYSNGQCCYEQRRCQLSRTEPCTLH